MKKDKIVKKRNYATVVYPESAPKDFVRTLEDCKVKAFISPLHDCDKNPDGTDKKPHYHVMIMFSGPVTVEYAKKEVIEKIYGVGVEQIKDVRGYGRYLCHLDNPEKHQYSVNDVKCLSGANYLEVIQSGSDKYEAIKQIIEYIKEYSIDCYADLVDVLIGQNEIWFRVVCDNTYFFKGYLSSRNWKEKEIERSDCNES